MYANDGGEGNPILTSRDADDNDVMRHTFSPPDSQTFLLYIPDYKKGKPLDSVLFSRGQGDVGVEFPVMLKPLPESVR